jgi:hypothetical protein
MSITKPQVLPAWADTAVPTTDIVQPSNAYISAGWQLAAQPPSRQYFNWLINFAANGVRYFSRRGIVDFDPAETYLTGDIVRGDDGLLHRSSVNANIGNVPSTSPSAWGALTTVTPAAGDNSSAIATTAFVQTTLGNKANTSGSYPGLSVGFATAAGSATTAGSAGSAGSVPWNGVSGKPTTVGGYAISDAITTAGGQTINGGLTLAGGDLKTYRSGGLTGVVFLNQAGSAYVYFDGATYQMPGAPLYVNGQQVLTVNVAAATYLTQSAAAATYLSQAAAASTYLTQGNATATYFAKASMIIQPLANGVPALAPGQIALLY